MFNEKKIFVGGINADDSIRLIDQTQYLNLENLREGVSEFGHAGELNNIPSTTLLFDNLPEGINKTIGRISDYGTNRTIFFNYNSLGEHGIYAYDYNAKTTYIILLSSQTESGLHFSSSFRIARNARVYFGLLIFTDFYNEPQCVSIEAGIELNQPLYVTYVQPYGTPIPYETITLIKRPPIYRPQASKSVDSGFDNNYIQNNAYQFCFRYQYKNYQYSALSAFSQLIPYNSVGSTYNFINIAMSFSEEIPDYVQQVDFIVRYGNFGKSFIIRSYNKNYPYDALAIQSHNASSVQLGFAFYDNVTGIALDDTTANTSFHLVPLKSYSLETAKNRLFLAHNLSGYDTPQKTSLTATLTTIDTGATGSYAGEWWFATLHANIASGGCQDSFMFPFIKSATAPSPFYYASSVRNSTIWNGGVGSVPGTINLSDCVGFATEADMIAYLKATQYPSTAGCPIGSPIWQVPYQTTDMTTNTTIINFVTDSANQFFKSNSTYYVTIAFFDRFRRKCGVNRNYVTMVIPKRTYSQTTFNAAIQWLLNNNYTLEEIPDWAYYYQIHISKNTTTRFFEQIAVDDSTYVLRDQDGTYTYGNATFDETTYAIGFDLSQLTGVGLGYTFAEGDFAVVYMSGVDYTLRVIGQDGNFVLLEPRDLGTLDSSTGALIELYTPYKPSATEPFYETGEVMPISDPATDQRAYTVLSGTINGDCYAIERTLPDTTLYIVEAMSPNDSIWFVWQTDTGWVNFIDDIGQTLSTTNISWSDTYIAGTRVNGLNVFQPLNTKSVGSSTGDIQKLQLTNKQTEQGTIMLVITDADHLSAYLSETQLVAAAANSGSPIQSTEVIGTINALKNGFGTTNPESVVEYNGVVFGISVLYGVVWQYAQNGVTAVSDFKMKSFFDRFSKRYIELGRDAVEALCGFSYIESCIDVSTKEFILMLPQTEQNSFVSILPSYLIGTGVWKYMLLYYTTDTITPIPLNLYYVYFVDGSSFYPEIYQNPSSLPLFVNFSDITALGFSEVALSEYILDFLSPPAGSWVNPQTPTFFSEGETVNLFQAEGATSIENRFDIYDGQPKMLVYKFEANKWNGAYLWLPDCMDYIGNRLVGWSQGELWLFNENNTSFNTIFGVEYPQRICFTANMNPSMIRDVLAAAIEGNFIKPNFSVFYSESPNVQITDLTEDDWTDQESVLYASVFRDRLSPNSSGTADQKLYTGDVIKSAYPLIMCEFTSYDSELIISFIDILSAVSRGHNSILNQKTNRNAT